jgi:1-acyl-sn-glycerol-3-phosphate acyltransferase
VQDWRVGHAQLAIRHRVPVVPAAIIGAEEAWPVLARLSARPFGAPYLPIPMSPVPLPVRIDLYFGAPIEVHAGRSAEAADDPQVLATAAARTRTAVEALIARGLASRSER